MAIQVQQSTVVGQFSLTPTPHVIETQTLAGYEITVVYSVTPDENYAGPPGTVAPPKTDA